MAKKHNTIFSGLTSVFYGKDIPEEYRTTSNYNMDNSDQVLFQTTDKTEYENKLAQMRQQKLLSYQWVKAGADNAMDSLAGYTQVKLMYRDADLMDGMPEIGTALDIVSEEACTLNPKGQMINVSSKSKRIQSILEDLFNNRLNIGMLLPMVVRCTCKYGNEFMLLNISEREGILGWKEMPVYEIERMENGYGTGTIANAATVTGNNLSIGETKFLWTGKNEGIEYKNWQVAHFRLLTDSFFLPYGVSYLHKARRSWRMLSMMEDAMLIYRLDRSVERRVYKIYVGTIDDKDVKPFVQEVANNFKRTPVIDPLTGQIDLRKNFMDVSTDYFIPVRSESAPNPIETLPSLQNQTAMDDIEYMQNKVFAALRVPKTFLNFQEAQGKGQNLSLMDIRFCRMINRIQQCILTELNKIAMIHLYLLGFGDDLTNFSLSLNNPSNQIESMELDDLAKKIQIAAGALADPGIGMPIFSLHRVLKEVMKMTDSEIKDMLNEIRLEKAMAAELATTQNIIKKTGMFDPVDRIYGDYEAMNGDAPQAGGQDAGGMEGGGGGGAPMMPGGPGDDMGGDIGGEGAETGMEEAPAADAGMPAESVKKHGSLLTENINTIRGYKKNFMSQYLDMLSSKDDKEENDINEASDNFIKTNKLINEAMEKAFSQIEEVISEDKNDNI